jgi:ADP-ribose pyrophosphatase YjhB (NUDIX family)
MKRDSVGGSGLRTAVVVLRGEHILLVRNQKEGLVSHNVPGARPRPDETPEDAARRELKEELGITVDRLDSIGVLEAEGAISHLFLVDDRREGAILKDASQDVPANGHRPDWVPLADVQGLSILPEALHVWLLFYLTQRE